MKEKTFCFVDFETTGRPNEYQTKIAKGRFERALPIDIGLIFADFIDGAFTPISKYGTLINPYPFGRGSSTWEYDEEISAYNKHKIELADILETGTDLEEVIEGVLEITSTLKERPILISDNPNFDTYFMEFIFHENNQWRDYPFHYSTWSPNLMGYLIGHSYKSYAEAKTHRALEDVEALFNYVKGLLG